ncbi:MAG: exodeoxyribonuclease V subunit gamma [Elusimicrobia bacterium]|nr:exodeoxyribonuclease V subunit gamma [Elusimicrobiota bacterium]
MSLRVFCGPFQPCLEEALVSRVRELAEARGRFAVVAPSRRLAGRLQRLLALEHGLALLDARFHTFHSLAGEIVEDEAAFDEVSVPDGLFHDKIVDRLLASSAARGPGRVSRGLAGAYRASIRDLADCGVDPAQLREHFGELLEPSELPEVSAAAEGWRKASWRRLAELLVLQERYLGRLRELGVMAPSGLARLAAEAVKDGRAAGLGRYKELLYYGFYDLTGSQADFFEAVGSAAAVTAFFPYRKGHPGYRFADRFYELKLQGGGAFPVHLDPSVSGRALGPVLDALSTPGRRATLPDPAAVAVISVSGCRDEVWAAAKEILRLRDASAVRCEDIGIVARTLEPYRSAVREILGENAIPFSMESGEPLLRHPIAKLAGALLQLGRRDFPSGEVLDIVESPYFRAERFAGASRSRGLVAAWKMLVERLGVEGGWRQWEGMVQRWTQEDLQLFPRLVDEGHQGLLVRKEDTAELWRLLSDLRARLQGPGTCAEGAGAEGAGAESAGGGGWATMARHARGLLEDVFKVPRRDGGFAAWSAALEAVDSLAVFDKACPGASWNEFLETLDEKLRRSALEAGPGPSGVRVLDAMDARGESFRVLFLLGMQEGVFPRQVREDPLLRDEVRRELSDAAGYWVMPKKAGYDEERLLFHLLATSASEKVYCVYQRSDDEGKAAAPSIYLRELCQACGRDVESMTVRRVARQPIAKLRDLELDCPKSLSPKEASLLAAHQGLEAGAFFERLERHIPAFSHRALFQGCLRPLSVLNGPGEPGAMDGIVGPPAAFLSRLDARGLSPSALQTFRQCPFRFFASRLLRLKEDEAPAELGDLAARTKGDFYHKVLERFYRALWPEGASSPPREDAWAPELGRVVEEVMPPDAWRRLGIYPVLWQAVRAGMTRRLREFVRRDFAEILGSGLLPARFETVLNAMVGAVRINGKVDRVDLGAGGSLYRVVDYKSTFAKGRGKSMEALVRSMEVMQPPLYLELVEKQEGLLPGGAKSAGAFFYVLEESDDTTGASEVQRFPPEAWTRLRGPFLCNIEEYRLMIGRGHFFITPQAEGKDGGACGTCPFPAVCRKSHRMTRQRAERSALRARFDKFLTIPAPKKDGPGAKEPEEDDGGA